MKFPPLTHLPALPLRPTDSRTSGFLAHVVLVSTGNLPVPSRPPQWAVPPGGTPAPSSLSGAPSSVPPSETAALLLGVFTPSSIYARGSPWQLLLRRSPPSSSSPSRLLPPLPTAADRRYAPDIQQSVSWHVNDVSVAFWIGVRFDGGLLFKLKGLNLVSANFAFAPVDLTGVYLDLPPDRRNRPVLPCSGC